MNEMINWLENNIHPTVLLFLSPILACIGVVLLAISIASILYCFSWAVEWIQNWNWPFE